MTNKKQKKANKKLKRFFSIVIVSAILCILIYVIYSIVSLAIHPTDVFLISKGKIVQEEGTIGYVIREEIVLESGEEENGLIQIKNEGEKVAKGESIFKYYTINEQELNDKIQGLNTQIQEALQGQTDIFLTSDIKALENRIQMKIDGLKDKNNVQEIGEYKNDINGYINKKAKIIGDLSPSGSYVKDLISQKAELENELYQSTKYINAPTSGIVSYRIDNLESIFSITDFSNLTKTYLESLDLKTGQIVTTSSEKGKIINNFECYIAITSNSKQAQDSEIGDKVAIRLADQKEIKASIEYKNDNVIVLKILTGVEELINYRRISLDVIWWEVDGLKVPKTAVLYKDGLSYVVVKKNGKTDDVLVKVVKENNNYCVIENYSTEDLQVLGYSTSEINSLKSIKLYDEILLDPDVENSK